MRPIATCAISSVPKNLSSMDSSSSAERGISKHPTPANSGLIWATHPSSAGVMAHSIRGNATGDLFADAKKKIRYYTGTSPCGSRMGKRSVNCDNMRDELRKEDKILTNMWKKSEIDRSKADINDAAKILRPAEGAELEYSEVNFPGDRCFKCRTDVSSTHQRLAVFKYTMNGEVRIQNGKQSGVIVGIVGPRGEMRRYDLAMVKNPPAMFLALTMHIEE